MKANSVQICWGLVFFAASGSAAEKFTEVKVTSKGFEPSSIMVQPNAPSALKITRVTDQTCAKEIVFPKLNIKKVLPLNEPVIVQLGKLEKKQELSFACGMNMMSGVIVAQ